MMLGKIALFVLLVAAVSGFNLHNSRKWIPKNVYVTPNPKNTPFDILAQNFPVQQQKTRPKVTDLVRVAECGTAPAVPKFQRGHDAKIVGGQVVDPPHKYPWQVALYIDFLYFCGGSVISKTWVMTAAHCLLDVLRVRVVLGAQDLSVNEESQLSLVSTSFIIHESYNPLNINYDIAMIQLPQTLVFNDFIQPVCLPAPPDLGAGVAVSPSGWGRLSDSLILTAKVLHEVTVLTITNADCARYYGTEYITDAHICIDDSGGSGTCNGDSGGPLNYPNGGVTETRGITSFGASLGCESGAPDAFTRVTHYLQWIQDNTGVTRA